MESSFLELNQSIVPSQHGTIALHNTQADFDLNTVAPGCAGCNLVQ